MRVDALLLLPLLLQQIEGGFVQGMGWLCLEEMIWGDKVGAGCAGASGYRTLAVALVFVTCVPQGPSSGRGC